MTSLNGWEFPEEVIIENEFDYINDDVEAVLSSTGKVLIIQKPMRLQEIVLKTDMSYEKYEELKEKIEQATSYSIFHEGLDLHAVRSGSDCLKFEPVVHSPERTSKMYGYVTLKLKTRS